MSFVRGRHAFHKRPSSSSLPKSSKRKFPASLLVVVSSCCAFVFTYEDGFCLELLETIECDRWGADLISTPNATAETTLHDRIPVSHLRVSERLLFDPRFYNKQPLHPPKIEAGYCCPDESAYPSRLLLSA